MANLKEIALALLGSATVDMKTAGATTIFNVPTGKVARISHIVVANPTASLADGTDYDFTQWTQTVDLSGLTTDDTDYTVLDDPASVFTELAAATAFQITVNTGSTLPADADIYVFGFLEDV